MKRSFLNIIKQTKERVEDDIFLNTHRLKDTYFTRSSGKMRFSEAIYFILKGIKKTLQIELDNWFWNQGRESMTKQSFSELRQKISPQAFVELNDIFVSQFYEDSYKKYKGFRLLAIDGSITEIPNTELNREYFGYYHNQSSWKQSRAMATVIYDVENDIIVESDIRSWKSAERAVAMELIERLEEKNIKNNLFLFDRGYPSVEMFNFLAERHAKYLIRVKNKKFHKKIDDITDEDKLITLENCVEKLRVINVTLSTGETEKLITNIYDESFTTNDFKELYFKRWGIETKYSQLKSRYELENFSGCLPIAIEQDFYANIYLSNMLALAKDEANEKVKKEKKNLKYEYKVNTNIFVGKMIPMLVCVFLEEDSDKRGKLYVKVMKSIEKNIVPIRPDRSFPRREPSRKTKYPYTRRRAL